MNSLFPDVCTDDLARSRDFYRDLLGFEVIFENSWYVQMHHPKQPAAQIAFVLREHDSVPKAWQARPQGVIVTVELDDVDACHGHVRALGIEPVYALVSEVWGQRHFMVEDPNGLLVDVVQLIEPVEGA
jgi:catechol 2,3-dioxygenase-like lactoylglutathione lyase family enzyme